VSRVILVQEACRPATEKSWQPIQLAAEHVRWSRIRTAAPLAAKPKSGCARRSQSTRGRCSQTCRVTADPGRHRRAALRPREPHVRHAGPQPLVEQHVAALHVAVQERPQPPPRRVQARQPRRSVRRDLQPRRRAQRARGAIGQGGVEGAAIGQGGVEGAAGAGRRGRPPAGRPGATGRSTRAARGAGAGSCPGPSPPAAPLLGIYSDDAHSYCCTT
jgi:hypothetical protein